MEAEVRRRRRPALSCIECRRRKIKCDRNDPCAHCTLTNNKCVYKTNIGPTHARQQNQSDASDSMRRSLTSGSPASQIQQQRSPARLLELRSNNSTGPESNAESVECQQTPDAATSDSHTHRAAFGEEPQLDLPNLSLRVQQLERLVQHNEAKEPLVVDQGVLSLRSDVQDAQISISKARVIRWSNWTGTTHEFRTIFACYLEYSGSGKEISNQDGETSAVVTCIRDLLAKCKTLARLIKVERPSRNMSSLRFRVMAPSRVLADAMTNLYFQSFEFVYRILHIPTFWNEYQKYWSDPDNAPPNLSLKILLVIAIASSLSNPEDTDAGFRAEVRHWVYAAETWLAGPLEKDRLDINGLQVHCLTILARQVLSIGGDLLWVSMGSLVNKAMQMCLHRDPDHLSTMSILQAEVRRRLWTTIVEMTVQSSLDSSMPPRISFSEFDTKAPSNVNDEDMAKSTTSLESNPKDIFTSTSMQLILRDSLQIRLRIVQLLNGLATSLSYVDVLSLSSQLTDACRVCSTFMNKSKSSITPFHRNLLDFLIRRFQLPLHCPFASQARDNPLFSHSLKLGLDTAMALMSPEKDGSYFNLMATGGGMFKESFRCATTAVSLELLTQVDSQRRDGTLKRNSQYRMFLKEAMQGMVTMSLERIRRGETNVKSHMFLSMTLAQVEAAEKDIPQQLNIAQAARDSLEICHDLLSARLSSSPLPNVDFTNFPTSSSDNNWNQLDLYFNDFLPDLEFSPAVDT